MNVIARSILSLLVLLTSPVWAAPVSDQTVAQLLELSGARTQLASFPDQVMAGMDAGSQQRPGMADINLQRVQASMRAAFDLEDLLTPLRAALKRELSEADAGKLLAWMRSDSGRRITRAEEATAAPSALQDMLAQLDAVRRDKLRLAFAHRIDGLMGVTDMTLRVQEYTGVAVHAALLNAEQPDPALDPEDYKRQVRAHLAGARPATEQMVTLSLAYAYRDIPVAELASYERFLGTPEATRFYRASMAGMTQGYAAVLDKMMKAMVDSMGQREIRT